MRRSTQRFAERTSRSRSSCSSARADGTFRAPLWQRGEYTYEVRARAGSFAVHRVAKSVSGPPLDNVPVRVTSVVRAQIRGLREVHSRNSVRAVARRRPVPSCGNIFSGLPSFHPFSSGQPMKIALVFVTLLSAVFAVWHFDRTRTSASEEELARVLELDPRKVAPSTRALLLLEAVPRLRESERGVAVERLRRTLETIPRGLVLHQPSFAVEAIRFSGDGRAVLWYGRTPAGLTVERWSQRLPRVVPWSTEASNATFVDEEGLKLITDSVTSLQKGSRTVPTQPGIVMTGDGRYLARVRDDVLWIWRVRDVAGSGWPRPAFWGEVPYPVTRVHCVASADLCGLDTPGRLTIVDVKKGKVLRSVSADRATAVHLSPSGRLAGVAGPRVGMTIHTVRDGRKIRVETPSLEDFAFSADEKSVVVLDRDGLLHSYDAATGKPGTRSSVLRQEQWTSPSHIEPVGDGRFVAWGAEKVRMVGADLSTVAARFDDGGEVVKVKTNARGDRLAIARRTGPLTVWDVSPKITVPFVDDELLESACGHIGRTLTAEEWATYIPNRRYAPYCD
ncbi:MAG TPA: hypothetical protein VF432_09200 [Thermoanaerobaculia bacterium]